MKQIRVIGLGQKHGGDDGCGLAVVQKLKNIRFPKNLREIQFHEIADPSDLIELTQNCDRVVIVDALLSPEKKGQMIAIDLVDLAEMKTYSTHGLGVAESLELAQTLYPDTFCEDLSVIGIGIAEPQTYENCFSPAVQRGIEQTVDYLKKHLTE